MKAIDMNTYKDFAIAKIVAAEYKNGTAGSERVMAKKHNINRSKIQSIKKEVVAGVWDVILAPKPKKVRKVKTVAKVTAPKLAKKYPGHNVRMTKVDLTNITHRKQPTMKSARIYAEVKGDFDKFTLRLLATNPVMTKAYINGQYHRCENHLKSVRK